MYKFSDRSKKELLTCHPKIQRVAFELIQIVDFTVLEGHRSPEKQLKLYEKGYSKVKAGKHNYTPSLAIDIAPFPIPKNWGEDDSKERDRFVYLGGMWMAVAGMIGYKFRWGGDWDMDNSFKDNKWDDLVHFELVGEY